MRMVFPVILMLLSGCASAPPQMGAFGSAHEHADFKVYINGAKLDFSQAKYQDSDNSSGGEANCALDTSKMVHLHDGDGDVLHKHATGATWGYFFSTLGMRLNDSCLALDNGTSYCNAGEKSWQYFVNGDRVKSIKDLEIRDLNRVLITYGASYEEVVRQYASVTSKAALQGTGAVCGIPKKP